MAATRDPEQERQAEGIAYGLFVLNSPIGVDHRRRWAQLPEQERELLQSKARFVQTYAGLYLTGEH